MDFNNRTDSAQQRAENSRRHLHKVEIQDTTAAGVVDSDDKPGEWYEDDNGRCDDWEELQRVTVERKVRKHGYLQ